MFSRIVKFVGLSSLFVVPTAAQFGLGKKKGTSFQEMNEKAKQKEKNGADAGGLAGLESLLGDIDPEALQEQLGDLGNYFDEAMDIMSKMTPEELEAQMKDAMEMLSGGDMMKGMLGMQNEIIDAMAESGQIDAEELAKYKADPEYFEQKMKESMGQLQELFGNPETLKLATDGIKGLTDLYKNPEQFLQMFKDDDEKIEEIRLELLKNPDLGIPGSDLLTPEMKELLNDPQKWRESVKSGLPDLVGAAGGDVASPTGMGEL